MQRLGIFAKYWAPGAVKTRLAATLGDAATCELYRVFIETALRRFATTGDTRRLVCTPPSRLDAFRAMAGDDWRLELQTAGDLGHRMRGFFERALADGARHVLLIGSDSPTLPRSHVTRAFELLRSNPIVLCPAEDGGYCLIGIADAVPPVFEGIAWSTPAVWPQTLDRLSESGIRHATLPAWYDIDQWDDLQRLKRELDALGQNAGPLTDLQQAVDKALRAASGKSNRS